MMPFALPASRLWRTLLFTLLAAAAALPLSAQQPPKPAAPKKPAPAAPPAAAESETIDQLVLRDETLDQVLALLERLTGRTILRAPNVACAPISFNSNRPLTKAEAVLALESLLTMNNIGIAPLGERFLKVVPLQQVRTESPEFVLDSLLGRPATGKVVTKLFQLSFLRTSEVQAQIVPLLNPMSSIVVPFERSNSLLITDAISNLQRVEQLLQRVDRPAEPSVVSRFYPIRNAKASDLATQLRNLGSGALASQFSLATTINADDRTNQIIVTCDPRQTKYFDEVIAKLDIPADPNTRTEVIYLKNADAKEVASLLDSLVSKKQQANSERRGATPVGAPPPNTASTPDSGSAAATDFSKLLTIVPDTRTNAVVVAGTQDDIRLIRQLIDNLDIVLAQVRIEVVIAEVSKDNDWSAGLSGNQTMRYEGLMLNATNPPRSVKFTNAALNLAGLGATGHVRDQTLEAILKNSGRKGTVRILNSPILVTTHNKEASLFVGESQPTVSNIQSTATTSTTPSVGTPTAFNSSVTYRDAGTELTIKPLIGSDGTIQLDIDQKIDAFGTKAFVENIGPPINQRRAKSFVSVADGQIVVLGGLTRQTRDRTRSRFGPIPFLSDLLGGFSRTDSSTELLLFIRPKVIRSLDQTTPDALGLIEGRSDAKEIQLKLAGSTPEKAKPEAAAPAQPQK